MNMPMSRPLRVTAPPDAARVPVSEAVRSSLVVALVTLGLATPILLFRLDQGPANELVLAVRIGLVAALCGLAFAGNLFALGWKARRAGRHVAESAGGTARRGRTEGWRAILSAVGVPLFLGIAVSLPLVALAATGSLSGSRYWIDLGILIITYVMLGWGLNIVVGLAGLLDLGYVAFYAVGAYSYALLATTFGVSFWLCLPLAGILAAFFGILLGFPILRLRGDYLAIVTLAFGEIIRLVLINWVELTGGGAGISSIPRVTFFGVPFSNGEGGFAALFGLTFNPMHRIVFLYYLILVLALVTHLVAERLRRLPIGRAWEALREDDIACRSLGINTTTTKLTAFAIGALFGGFAGAFFAVRQGFVSPESFNFLESAIILAIVVLGGMGSQIGVAIAAVVLVGMPELLRNLTFLNDWLGDGFDPNEYRLMLFGLAMVVMMIWRPRGLVSARVPSIVLRKRVRISSSLVGEGRG